MSPWPYLPSSLHSCPCMYPKGPYPEYCSQNSFHTQLSQSIKKSLPRYYFSAPPVLFPTSINEQTGEIFIFISNPTHVHILLPQCHLLTHKSTKIILIWFLTPIMILSPWKLMTIPYLFLPLGLQILGLRLYLRNYLCFWRKEKAGRREWWIKRIISKIQKPHPQVERETKINQHICFNLIRHRWTIVDIPTLKLFKSFTSILKNQTQKS